MKSGKMKRRIAALVLILLLAVGQAGCSMLKSGIHDLHGSIFGNEYNIDIFDNMGIRTLRTHGEKIDIDNNVVEETSYSSDSSPLPSTGSSSFPAATPASSTTRGFPRSMNSIWTTSTAPRRGSWIRC